MLRVLVDSCLSRDWIGLLSQAGYHATYWPDTGSADASDSEVFDWAQAQAHVVLTHDLDFGALLATRNALAPSVVQIRAQSHLPDDVGRAVLSAMERFSKHLEDGAIVTVDTYRAKVRALPLT